MGPVFQEEETRCEGWGCVGKEGGEGDWLLDQMEIKITSDS